MNYDNVQLSEMTRVCSGRYVKSRRRSASTHRHTSQDMNRTTFPPVVTLFASRDCYQPPKLGRWRCDDNLQVVRNARDRDSHHEIHAARLAIQAKRAPIANDRVDILGHYHHRAAEICDSVL